MRKKTQVSPLWHVCVRREVPVRAGGCAGSLGQADDLTDVDVPAAVTYRSEAVAVAVVVRTVWCDGVAPPHGDGAGRRGHER